MNAAELKSWHVASGYGRFSPRRGGESLLISQLEHQPIGVLSTIHP